MIDLDEELNSRVVKVNKRKNQKIDIMQRLRKYLYLIYLCGIFSVIIYVLYGNPFIAKEYEIIPDKNNIQAPIQTPATGGTKMNIDDVTVNIEYLANYTIYGRVVDVQDYGGYNTINKLGPRDLGIVWGFLANQQNSNKLTWYSGGNRTLHYYTEDSKWYNSIGGSNSINPLFSNNHLIPSNDKIKSLIKKIKESDYIKIEGYLVNTSWQGNYNGYYTWNSSTSRYDSGDGACEVIYVTNITWLKEG